MISMCSPFSRFGLGWIDFNLLSVPEPSVWVVGDRWIGWISLNGLFAPELYEKVRPTRS